MPSLLREFQSAARGLALTALRPLETWSLDEADLPETYPSTL
jgi:hypothetical protein